MGWNGIHAKFREREHFIFGMGEGWSPYTSTHNKIVLSNQYNS